MLKLHQMGICLLILVLLSQCLGMAYMQDCRQFVSSVSNINECDRGNCKASTVAEIDIVAATDSAVCISTPATTDEQKKSVNISFVDITHVDSLINCFYTDDPKIEYATHCTCWHDTSYLCDNINVPWPTNTTFDCFSSIQSGSDCPMQTFDLYGFSYRLRPRRHFRLCEIKSGRIQATVSVNVGGQSSLHPIDTGTDTFIEANGVTVLIRKSTPSPHKGMSLLQDLTSGKSYFIDSTDVNVYQTSNPELYAWYKNNTNGQNLRGYISARVLSCKNEKYEVVKSYKMMEYWIDANPNRESISYYGSEPVPKRSESTTYPGKFNPLYGSYFLFEGNAPVLVGSENGQVTVNEYIHRHIRDICGIYNGTYALGPWRRWGRSGTLNRQVAFMYRDGDMKCWTVATRLSNQGQANFVVGPGAKFNGTMYPEMVDAEWSIADHTGFVAYDPKNVDDESTLLISPASEYTIPIVVSMENVNIQFENQNLIPMLIDAWSDDKNVYVMAKTSGGKGTCLFSSKNNIFYPEMMAIESDVMDYIFPNKVKEYNGWDTVYLNCARTKAKMDYEVKIRNYNPDIDVDTIEIDNPKTGTQSMSFWDKITRGFSDTYDIFVNKISGLYLYAILAIIVYLLIVLGIVLLLWKGRYLLLAIFAAPVLIVYKMLKKDKTEKKKDEKIADQSYVVSSNQANYGFNMVKRKI